MKILIVTPSFPYPPDSGAKIRIFNIIRYLSREDEVHLISLTDCSDDDAVPEMQRYCKKVHAVRTNRRPALLQLPGVLYNFVRGLPFMLKYAQAPELKKALEQVCERDNYDIIQFEHSYMAYNVKYLSKELSCKTVLSFHNIASLQYYRIYQLEKRLVRKVECLFEWVPMLRWESKIAQRFHKSLVVSELDRILLRLMNPGLDVSVVPNGVDARKFSCTPLAGRKRNIIFVGLMDYGPNADAVLYFHREIFPLIKEKVPDLGFMVVGSDPPREVRELSRNPDVVVTGRVDDLRPYYQKALVAVIPLRSGGGTRLKIIEALSTGTPVVSTSVGCEGLEVSDGEHIMIADSPEAFAAKVVSLIEDSSQWLRLSSQGRELVEKTYDWEYLTASLRKVYQAALK
ncbi:glycosyl transferase family 1 [Geomonas silvestris]|uniref:Glycosyl transferase family 1 n=1 Tax=Geomonas silvestris TaxID=2740184 RepID=A0A6V8MJH8_9BACT|nr:glycosyltransferase family 4 protein [Geomonas silvestris]GFO60116.1 glycosyl transferase family 1 [Geomonas silvestris]